MDKLKILVVEDECITAMGITKILKVSGYFPFTARSTDDPVKKAIQKKPDLLIIDLELQEHNGGLIIAEKIKELMDIPTIYLTASYDKKLFQSDKLMKSHIYMLKPFDEDELINNIKAALNTHQAGF